MYHNKVELCGINTAQLPVLTEREKAQLLRRVKQGDRQARQEMIQGNLRLVLSVVQRFSGRGENLDDLFQVGCIGLIKAIDHFDIQQGVRFSTYAVSAEKIAEIDRQMQDRYKRIEASEGEKNDKTALRIPGAILLNLFPGLKQRR